MKISLRNEQKFFPINSALFCAAAEYFLKAEKITTDEVVVHFVGSKKIISLHRQFFDDPTLTDCISFPLDGKKKAPYHILGEIFICPSFAFEYKKKRGQSLTDKAIEKELLLYLVHGLLHLIGYDDIDPIDRKEMRRKELLHMKRLAKIQHAA